MVDSQLWINLYCKIFVKKIDIVVLTKAWGLYTLIHPSYSAVMKSGLFWADCGVRFCVPCYGRVPKPWVQNH